MSALHDGLEPDIKERLRIIIKYLKELAESTNMEPLDPKISALLYLAADIGGDQLSLNKVFHYHSPEKPNSSEEEDYKYFDNKNDSEQYDDNKPQEEAATATIEPTIADEISKWFDDGMPERNNDE